MALSPHVGFVYTEAYLLASRRLAHASPTHPAFRGTPARPTRRAAPAHVRYTWSSPPAPHAQQQEQHSDPAPEPAPADPREPPPVSAATGAPTEACTSSGAGERDAHVQMGNSGTRRSPAAVADTGASPREEMLASWRAKKGSPYGILLLVVVYLCSLVLIWPMFIAHPLVLLLDRQRRRFHDFVALLWMRCSFSLCLLRPRVANRQNLLAPGMAVVYVANHSSNLDIFPLAFLGRKLKFVSKSEIFKLPIIGWAMQMTGMIGVRRTNRRGQMEAYRNMVIALKAGVSLVVYPEGTRSETGKMRKFQLGAFRAAKAAGVPIVPVTILDVEVEELRDRAFKEIDSGLDPALRTVPSSMH